MYRKETAKAETDAQRNNTIIADYKQICSQLSERLENQQKAARQERDRLRVSCTCRHQYFHAFYSISHGCFMQEEAVCG